MDPQSQTPKTRTSVQRHHHNELHFDIPPPYEAENMSESSSAVQSDNTEVTCKWFNPIGIPATNCL
jgi:hypothetical protein